jgi:hypothetical protein
VPRTWDEAWVPGILIAAAAIMFFAVGDDPSPPRA